MAVSVAALAVVALVLSGCMTDPCTGWKPQTFAPSERKHLTSETKRVALENNLYGQRLGCPAFQ